MAYYRFPPSITTTYTDAPHAGETIVLNWTSMISYPYRYQISALMREIGQRVGMRYLADSETTIWYIIIGVGTAVVMAILLLEMESPLAMEISSMGCR